MTFLLDTHLLIWAAAEPRRIPRPARTLIGDSSHLLLFSDASIWEVAIKYGLGRSNFRLHPGVLREGLLNHGYIELPVTGKHTLSLSALPLLHKDPFDRILIAQAISESVTLLTVDVAISQYSGPIRKV